jgi:hypothetical protein
MSRGAEIPAREWRDMIGSFGSTGDVTRLGMGEVGCISYVSLASPDRLSSIEVVVDPSIWKNFFSE